MTNSKKVARGTPYSDDEIELIRKAYKANKGIKDGWLIRLAKEMGRPYGSVSAIGSSLGLGDKNRLSRNPTSFTDEEKRVIRTAYREHQGQIGWLDDLAKQMGRRKHSICRCARRMGFTTNSRSWEGKVHPRGFGGKTHSAKVRKQQSARSKRLWGDPASKFNTSEFREKMSRSASKRMVKRLKRKPESVYSATKKGWLEFERGKKRYFFRSEWEMNYARYLDRQKKEKRICDWWYEADTFWFEKIKRGTRCYTPDFKIKGLDGEITYHEVKGWMDSKSKTKLKRMAKYHSETKIVLVDEKAYRKMEKAGAFSLD